MKFQKRTCSSKDDVGLDRLSEMPDQVIVHILSLMPTRDAVRTMLLRRFGNLWTFVFALMFDFSDYYVMSCSGDEDEDDYYEKEQPIVNEAISRFARFVQNVLMLHQRSTIDSFHVEFDQSKGHYDDERIIDDYRVWLRFAVDRQVKDMTITSDLLKGLAPPRFVFTSQSLVTLTLKECKLEVCEYQLHMGSLRKLTLFRVVAWDEAFNQLISACPSLQELIIESAQGLQNLNITSPSVSKLNLRIVEVPDQPFTLNCPYVKTLDIGVNGISSSLLLHVTDISSLQEVNIESLPTDMSSAMEAFFRPFRDVAVFTLSFQAFQQLCCSEIIDIPQNRWQRLVLQHPI